MTREFKMEDRSLLVVYTGHGKGKSTAAFGAVFRALGWGCQTAVVQFIKGKRETGEQRFGDGLPGVAFHVMGRGFTWESDDISKDARAARAAWEKAAALINSGDYAVVVLDELTYCFHYGFLDVEDIVAVFENRPKNTTVIVTGRDAPALLMEAADLVSEMRKIKHPYETSGKTFRALMGVDF